MIADAGIHQVREQLAVSLAAIERFWRERAPDRRHGGYLVNFDGEGRSTGTPVKYLNTQCRLLWWFSSRARAGADGERSLELARHGFEFIQRHFWDAAHGGWYWTVWADGAPQDCGKLVYGQSFALYALSEYALASGCREARQLALETFELLQRKCADRERGGYLENLERDWTVSPPGPMAGDRKSLDIHLHLLESFTVLAELSGAETHRDTLREVAQLIRDRMIDPVTGAGRNQFDLEFNPIPAIAIRRTWNAERTGDAPAAPTDTTSYGHNLELAWLLRRALELLGDTSPEWEAVLAGLVEHAIDHGVDREFGGVYRDGTARGGPLVLEKEFWQNAEAMVGLLDAYGHSRNPRHWDAFANVWDFCRRHFIAPCGEWRVLLDRAGRIIDGNVGNDWKVCYHTGRATAECLQRLEAMQREERA